MKRTFSIIAAVHDQSAAISENLPALLSQQYEGRYEVIVVDESSTDDTLDVLKQLKTDNPHLYTTFLPKYQFQRNRRRLALTIGVKAAKNDWVIFIDINTPPSSDTWLEELSAQIESGEKLQLGYISRKKGNVRLQPFYNLEDARSLVSKNERAEACIGHQGSHLRYLQGKYDFMVVKRSEAHEALRLFGNDLHGGRLFARSLRVALYNLVHQ